MAGKATIRCAIILVMLMGVRSSIQRCCQDLELSEMYDRIRRHTRCDPTYDPECEASNPQDEDERIQCHDDDIKTDTVDRERNFNTYKRESETRRITIEIINSIRESRRKWEFLFKNRGSGRAFKNNTKHVFTAEITARASHLKMLMYKYGHTFVCPENFMKSEIERMCSQLNRFLCNDEIRRLQNLYEPTPSGHFDNISTESITGSKTMSYLSTILYVSGAVNAILLIGIITMLKIFVFKSCKKNKNINDVTYMEMTGAHQNNRVDFHKETLPDNAGSEEALQYDYVQAPLPLYLKKPSH